MKMKVYGRFCRTAFDHAFGAIAWRRRSHVVAALVILPALIPLLLLVLPHRQEISSSDPFVFTQMAEMMYVLGITPLLALFFGATLLGEDIEAQTIAYLIVRPIPRSAWIIGRFGAYLAYTSLLLFTAILATFLSCSYLQSGFFSSDNLGLMFQYQAVAMASLFGYGAFCMMLGTIVRRPVIVGVLFIFGWQGLASWAPGLTHFLTIDKHIGALLPGGGRSILSVLSTHATETFQSDLSISPITAALSLLMTAGACVAVTTLAVMKREYTTPGAVTE